VIEKSTPKEKLSKIELIEEMNDIELD